MNENIVEILLVEDNEDDIELALRAFKKYNLANKVDVVRDGQEALDYFKSKGWFDANYNYNYPKVIFLDLKLPKVDGLEILKILKSDDKLKLIPVVVMTSSQHDRDMVDSYMLGVNSYINKPIDFLQFSEVISRLGYYWLVLNKRPY